MSDVKPVVQPCRTGWLLSQTASLYLQLTLIAPVHGYITPHIKNSLQHTQLAILAELAVLEVSTYAQQHLISWSSCFQRVALEHNAIDSAYLQVVGIQHVSNAKGSLADVRVEHRRGFEHIGSLVDGDDTGAHGWY